MTQALPPDFSILIIKAKNRSSVFVVLTADTIFLAIVSSLREPLNGGLAITQVQKSAKLETSSDNES